MKLKLTALLLLLLTGGSLYGQQIVHVVSGVATLDVERYSKFKVIVDQNITSVAISPSVGVPNLTTINILFVENSTGGFSVTFGGNTSGTCAVSTAANAGSSCTLQFDSSSNTWFQVGGGSGGGISSVSSLPATCTPGVTSPVQLSVAPFGVYQCGPNVNQWYPVNAQRTFSPLAYGAKFDTKFTYAMVATSGSNTITCPDCNFTTSNQGNLAVGMQSPYDSNHGVSLYAVIFTPGTICNTGFISATSVKICGTDGVTANNAAASCTPSNGAATICTFAWGSQDDTTAINAAATAAWTTGGSCGAVQLPVGAAFFSSQILAVSNTALSLACGGQTSTGNIISGVDTNQTGPEVYGQGPNNTVLIPYNFNFASCSGPDAGAADCVGGTDNLEAHDFAVAGLGQNFNTAAASGKVLVDLRGSLNGGACTGSTGFNLSFSNWAVNTGATGLSMGFNACGDATYSNIVAELFGSGAATNGAVCTVTSMGTVVTLSAVACFGTSGIAAKLIPAGNSNNAAGVINSYGGYYGETMVANGVVWSVQNSGANGIVNSYGDFIDEANVTGTVNIVGMQVNGTGSTTINFNGSSLGLNSANTSTNYMFFLNSQGLIHLRGSTLVMTGANNKLANFVGGSNAIIFDDGGNTYKPGGLESVFQAGGLVANTGIKGICTGTATASSTLALNITGLSTAGTGITTACTSTTIDKGVPSQGARTIQNLVCSSSATTVSVACTVLKNGVATAVTCTMTAATVCSDTIHSATTADGDLISYQIVSGAAETGANIHAVVEVN
jgi:hypothetical protein